MKQLIKYLFLLLVIPISIYGIIQLASCESETTGDAIKVDNPAAIAIFDSITNNPVPKEISPEEMSKIKNDTKQISRKDEMIKEISTPEIQKEVRKVDKGVMDDIVKAKNAKTKEEKDKILTTARDKIADEAKKTQAKAEEKERDIKEKEKCITSKTKELEELKEKIKLVKTTAEQKTLREALAVLKTDIESCKEEKKKAEEELSDYQKTLKILASLLRIVASVALAFGNPQLAAACALIAKAIESEANEISKENTDGDPETTGKESDMPDSSGTPSAPDTYNDYTDVSEEIKKVREENPGMEIMGGTESSGYFLGVLDDRYKVFNGSTLSHEIVFANLTGNVKIETKDSQKRPDVKKKDDIKFGSAPNGVFIIKYKGLDGNLYELIKNPEPDNTWVADKVDSLDI